MKYLDAPGDRHSEVISKYASFIKEISADERVQLQRKADEDRDIESQQRAKEAEDAKAAAAEKALEENQNKFESAKVELELAVEAFNRMVLGVQEVVSEASSSDKRIESQKIEKEFNNIKKQLVGLSTIDPSKDVSDLKTRFIEEVEEPFSNSQKWFLKELKDAPLSSVASGSTNTTKKEAVKLPSFEGDEKGSTSSFLSYPVWRKKWDVLIKSYEAEFRDTLLCDHLDTFAKRQITGFENNYEKAMSKLNEYYGDPIKVIRFVMKDVKSQSNIGEGDYRSLITYSLKLEHNFNRLSNLSLEHEMSNTTAMSSVVHKFPRVIGEQWNEHLSAQTSSVKARPFPEFIVWLTSKREVWERMSSSLTEGKKVAGGKTPAGAYFGETLDNTDSGKKCYKCKEEGHVIKNCPKKGKGNNQKGNRRINDSEAKRPKIKKFWCAFHKGDPTRACSSIACIELRKSDPPKRVQLLKENGDCQHCIGDHQQADCKLKSRICGGGKDNRGCSQPHNLHELFCVNAKCFVVKGVCLLGNNGDKSYACVVLQIMQIRSSRRGFMGDALRTL